MGEAPCGAVGEGAELAVVIPTFNEKDNATELVRRLDAALAGIRWEAIFVDDDSPDGTAEVVRGIARRDRRVRIIQRIGRRGLATACIEGMLGSAAPYLAVIDGDLQHDETLLPHMLEALKADGIDIVVGSRYVEGGSAGDWEARRLGISQVATRMARLVVRADLKDPMSGFMLRREVLHDSVRNLSGIGFKILLDIFASSPRPLAHRELPYTFRTRIAGDSKLDSMVAWEYLMLLLDKSVGRYVPVRFIPFAMVGATGVVVHMMVLALLYRLLGLSFVASTATAVLVAMTANFFLNNMLTYRDRRLRGLGLVRGWISFAVACSVGAVANVGIASYLLSQRSLGWVVSAIAGILVGVVWNYAVTSVYTWRKPRTAG